MGILHDTGNHPILEGLSPVASLFTLDRPTSNSTTQTVWDVHIREGTQILFLVQPAAEDQNTLGGGNARTSALITVTGKSSQGYTCLDTNSPSSTVVPAVTTSIPTFPGTTDPSGNVKCVDLITISPSRVRSYHALVRKRGSKD